MPADYLLLESGDHLLLEDGDDLLLESSTVDGLISLPLIDDSEVPPPSIAATATVPLPLLDDSAIYAPNVVFDQSTGLPLLDDSAIYAPNVVFDQSIGLSLLEGGWVFAPSVLGEFTSGLVVKHGTTVLDGSFGRSWRDELGGTGTFGLSQENSDPDLLGFDDIVTFEVDGVPRFAGRVEAIRRTTFGAGEEFDETSVLSGRGRLALTDQATVEPSRGLDALPVETTRSLSWVAPDFDDSTWGNAKKTNRVDMFHPWPASRTDRIRRPEAFPDRDAWWVWANRPDVSATDAPGGRCLFRHSFTLADEASLRVYVGTDNYGPGYFDGALVLDTDTYKYGVYYDIPEASAGEHVLAFSVLNTGRHGGVVFTVWTVDSDGLLDEVVTRSDSSTKCFPYVAGNGTDMPRVTAGWAVRQVVEEAQALGELGDMTLGFTDDLDSDGVPFTLVAEITVDVGRKFLDMLESLADWLVDVQMAPGANVLRMWNWGTRGGTPGVTVTATADPDTSEYEGLSHDGRFTRCNRLVVRYRGGYTEVYAAGYNPADVRSDFLDLSEVGDEATAQTIARNLMANRSAPSWAHTLNLAEVTSEPYVDFDNGDYITHLDQDGNANLQRVRAITFTQDDDTDLLSKVLETNDLRFEVEERHENWLRRKSHGALAGGARVATRSGEPLGTAVRISTVNVAEFSFDQPTNGAITGKRPADSSGNLIEIYVEVSTDDDAPTSSATTVRVWEYVYGTTAGTILGTVTVPAGEPAALADLDASKTYQDIRKYRAEVVTVGGGVTGVDVQLRAVV